MNFSFGKKNKKDNNISIIFDIRSSGVGGAIVSKNENDLSIIKYTKRENVYLDDIKDAKIFKEKIYTALDTVADDIIKNGFRKIANKKKLKIEKISCALTSPWYKSKLKNFSINEKNEVNFNKKYLNDLLKKEESADKIPENFSIIEKKILSVYMNGYETENPINKKAKKIQLSFYTSFMSSKIKKELENKISSKFHFNKIEFNSHPFVLISVIKNFFHSATDFLLIDISGEVTDIGLFKEGVLQNLTSIPAGTHFFVREISRKCSYEKNVAFSHLNMLSTDKLDPKCSMETKEVFETAKRAWLEKINEAVNKEWAKEKIPSIVFMTVDHEAKNLMDNIFRTKEASKIMRVNKEPTIHILNTESIKNLCEYDKDVKKDALLSVLSEFIILENH